MVGKRKARGRIATGAVFEQRLRATNEAGEILFLGRVSVVLDQPTRDGDSEIHLLTNLPAKEVRATVVADLYRRRWTIETGQAHDTSSERWCGAHGSGYHQRLGAA